MPPENYEVVQSRQGSHALAYSSSFRDLAREMRLSLKHVLQLCNQAEAAYAPQDISFVTAYEEHDITWHVAERQWEPRHATSSGDPQFEYFYDLRGRIFCMGKVLRSQIADIGVALLSGNERRRYFYLEIGGQGFFLKNLRNKRRRQGVDEFRNMLSAKSLFAKYKYAEVAEPAFAYQSSNESWFASKWRDLSLKGGYVPAQAIDSITPEYTSYNDYLEAVRVPLTDAAMSRFLRRYYTLMDRALHAGYIDAAGNIDYNPESDKFYLYDF